MYNIGQLENTMQFCGELLLFGTWLNVFVK